MRVQENIHSYYGSILNAVTAKSSVEQALLEMENKFVSKDTELVELKSSLQNLKECLEVLKAQQSEQYLKLSERLAWLSDHLLYPDILAELQKLTSNPKPNINVKDSTSQTSPSWIQDLSLENQEKVCWKSTKVCRTHSSQTQPYVTSNILRDGTSILENQAAKDLTYRRNLTAATTDMDPITGPLHKKGNVTINKTNEIAPLYNLDSQACINYPPFDCDSNVKLFQSGPDIRWQLTQEMPQSRPTVMEFRKEKETKYANLLHQYPCNTNAQNPWVGQADTENIVRENMNQITRLNTKHKNKRPKKPCRNKKVVRKKRAYTSTKKKKGKNVKFSFDSPQIEFYGQASLSTESSQKDIFALNSDTCVSASAVSQNVLCKLQASNGEMSLPLLSSFHNSAVKGKEILETKNSDISKTGIKFSQWDCSSQESSLFQYNIKREHEIAWLSPLNSLVNSSPFPTVKKGEQKIRFYSFLLDSSDDSD
ncbi:interactor of HORMAD1 protein 1 isoform X1 [Rhinatrema bivittatum]|uniref:interactor of HORMAD1 protein 1 isoform X1 n=1 Tax=Rhinatrema bivittatum TaxID=194408 RepID=UPI00112EF4F6|nr:interactor of HORMAD1 protein 1 isoform X1 [Rhinatrema bivittatum]